MVPKSTVWDYQKHVKRKGHPLKIEDALDSTQACKRSLKSTPTSFSKPRVRGSKSNNNWCHLAYAMEDQLLRCSRSSWRPFWRVRGLLHGGAGQKKVVILATWSVSQANFALWGCLDTNLEAIWMLFAGSRFLLRPFSKSFSVLGRVYIYTYIYIYMCSLLPNH